MSNTTSNGLYAKIARIMGRIDYLPKDGRNAHFGYAYATDRTVYDTVRKLLAEEGVAVIVSMVDAIQERYTVAGKGGDREERHTRALFEFTLADGETGQTVTCRWQAEAQGGDDKGINKCATAALKYWLLKTFVIPTGDDPDGDAPASNRPLALQRPTRPPAKPAPEPDPLVAAAADLGGEARWTTDQAAVKRFWRYCTEDLGLTQAEALDALQVDRLEGYPGDKATAVAALNAYVKAHAAAPKA